MYCHECGTANTVDSKYCKECGTKINDGFRTMMLSVQDLAVGQSEASLDRLTRLLDMAFWHNEAGNVDAAITASEAALAINPNSTTAHSLLGTLYEKKGEDAQAILHFESVLALNPDSVADAAKLDQLRRGVHVKAVAPPVAHQWVPPALMKMGPKIGQTWAAWAEPLEKRSGPLPRAPLVAAGVAALVVLASGLLLTRPWARAETVKTYPVTVASYVPPAVSVNRSAFAGEAAADTPAPAVKPWIMQGGASSTASYPPASYPAPPLTAHDPFAGSVFAAPRVAGLPLWSLSPVPRRLAALARRGRIARALPVLPLRLTALPAPGSDEIAPAPVMLPSSARPFATVAAIPQHTVVVGSLGSAEPASGEDNGPVLPSHIHITVRQVSSSTDSAPVSSGDGGSDAKADTFQQRALALQQQGSYGQARLAYQTAIHAYEAQIAAGSDVETAQRGLAACQTGLQICQQSQ